MKSTLLAGYLLLAAFSGWSQKIHFTDSANQWKVVSFVFPSDIATEVISVAYSRDTIISGLRYRQLQHSIPTMGYDFPALAVREDTVAGVIYCRFVSDPQVVAADTLEHLLFDYRLKPGDTFRVDYAGNHFRHIVQKLDSVQLDGKPYRRWQTEGFNFIEGIGPLNQPAYSLAPPPFENNWQLRCFTTRGTQPACTPGQRLLSLGSHQPPWGVMTVDTFDNVESCRLKTVGVNQTAPATIIQVIPNPGAAGIHLVLPDAIGAANLRISDCTGRTLAVVRTTGIRMPLAQYLPAAGVYFYSLQDAQTGNRYAGRFVFAP